MEIPFIPCHSTNRTSGRMSKIEYIVIHYTANNGDTAKGNCNYFANNANLKASAHYFVDENEVCQSVADENTAYHVGAVGYAHAKCRNANSIGVELCSRKDSKGNYYFKPETVSNAVVLTRQLMQKYGVTADRVLRHYDVTGKDCPRPFVVDVSAWERFKAELEDNLNIQDTTVKVGSLPVSGKLIDGVTYVPLRDMVEAIKSALAVTWSKEDGAGVDIK